MSPLRSSLTIVLGGALGGALACGEPAPTGRRAPDAADPLDAAAPPAVDARARPDLAVPGDGRAADAPEAAPTATDLRPLWDEARVLRNPHKGWYHHQYDGSTKIYPAVVEDLKTFPGMDHVYLRLPWSALEPAEGQFEWRLVDDEVAKWTALGLGLSVRITCKETDLVYATPEWVRKAGAAGAFYKPAPDWGVEAWQPDYGDPVFLDKLERFHQAFAARYDGKPWLEYVDVGSYGDWGEGHNSFSSKKPAPMDVVGKHLDLHARAYKRTRLYVSDDLPKWSRARGEEAALRKHLEGLGISYRDDSILVDYYVKQHPATFSIERPEYFAETYRARPTLLELQHYEHVKREGNWIGVDGAQRGAEIVRGALAISHASYIGYHHWAKLWLKENPGLARELANKVGYWYFPRSLATPAAWVRGRPAPVEIVWENRGVAPAYHPFTMRIRLVGERGMHEERVPSDNTRWLPDAPTTERYELVPPATLPPGRYALSVHLVDDAEGRERPIELGLAEDARTQPAGGYRLVTVDLR
jgi:hypothetical protein